MIRNEKIERIAKEREILEKTINSLIQDRISHIQIASPELMPYGWRKSGKGRTVWRIIEEIIGQNLEMFGSNYGLESVIPADSEVGVYDFEFELEAGFKSFVNIKSAVQGGRVNKDDVSKADGLISFIENNPECNLYVATFLIKFNDDMKVELLECIVCPTAWIPDVYVNPSNNGNLQSAKFKNIDEMVHRTNEEFLKILKKENKIAKLGGRTKIKKSITQRVANGEDISEIADLLGVRVKDLMEI
ncbi:hypothetical protein AB685_06265 [Bacillus sp. LL01]|uniref:hypothetical protein n=1 Tax=Bacillus sp. LL01 TaxID=1665556 RepID=UPI00064D36CC|nr:hypothetical protein [Bacillus sp. LL01]KMJ60410.1 hypothetical protein AB685_06265 [Bacillus sp. LL01]